MSLPHVTHDRQTGYAYIYLANSQRGIVNDSVNLEDLAEETGLDALHSLVLDFDAKGRLVGIEIAGPAEGVVRDELLASARTL